MVKYGGLRIYYGINPCMLNVFCSAELMVLDGNKADGQCVIS